MRHDVTAVADPILVNGGSGPVPRMPHGSVEEVDSGAGTRNATMTVTVRTPSGLGVHLQVSEHDTVLSVKRQLERSTAIGVPPAQQRLFCGGREMDDSDVLGLGPTPIKVTPPRSPPANPNN